MRNTQPVQAPRRAAPSLTRINAWFDLALGSLTIGCIVSAYLDKTTHITLGVTTTLAATFHLALHWRWMIATAGRLARLPRAVQRKAALVLALLLSFVPLALSGGIVSLIYAPRVSDFHTWAFYGFIGLVLLHLFMSRGWIAARLRRRRA